MKAFLALFLLCFLSSPASGNGTRYFPQIGAGTVGPFQFQTSIIFVNTGSDAQIQLDFLDSSGKPLDLDLTPYGSGSSYSIPIAAGNAISAQTPRSGPVKIGYARFTAPASVGGTAVFTGFDAGSGTVLYEAGVPATAPLSEFSLFLDSLGNRDTGVAVVAPLGSSPADDGHLPAASGFTIRLYDKESNLIESRDWELGEGEKLSQYVYQFFDGETRELAREMEGSVSLVSSAGGLAAVTLRQFLPELAFPQQVPTLTAFPVVERKPGWQLIWADEFEGSQLDRSKWEPQLGNGCPSLCGWGNNEREYYTEKTENLRLENGHLVIEARNDRPHDVSYPYTSARIRTREKGDWKYGRLVIRARLPKGKGLWPAIWLLPTDEVYGGWAASGEIDIMESVGHEPHRVHGTLHYGASWPNNVSGGLAFRLEGSDFSQDFHEFSLEWEEGEFRWYVDGKLFQRQVYWYTEGHPFPAPFDQRFHLIMNVAVGGRWPGNPDSSTVFPQRMEVDYVRVYQRAP